MNRVGLDLTDGEVPLRHASTVILLRDTDSGIEVFLQRRVNAMAFAGGMTVFPGGGVDRADTADGGSDVRWAGTPPSWWAEQFGVEPPLAEALVLAAVRETFEECGVLLAGTTATDLVADATVFDAGRRAVEGHEQTFSDFLAENDLVVRADLLQPFANWLTPIGERRRYDTRFFVAQAPEGQTADGHTSEAVDAGWYAPAEALDEWRAHRRNLLPPTWTTLYALSEFDTVSAALAAEYDLAPRRSTLVTVGDETRVVFPGSDEYYAELLGQEVLRGAGPR